VARPWLGVNNARADPTRQGRPAPSWASLGIGTGWASPAAAARQAGIDIDACAVYGSSAYHELLPDRVQAGFVVLDSAVPHIKAAR
jgi:hypothetical protein